MPKIALITGVTGQDGAYLAVSELAALIAEVVGFEGTLALDPTKPDGPPRKLLDVGRRSALGWAAESSLTEGLTATYQMSLDHGALDRSVAPHNEPGSSTPISQDGD